MGWTKTTQTGKVSKTPSMSLRLLVHERNKRKYMKSRENIIDDKKKIKAALVEQFSSGEINRDQYKALEKRMDDISDELLEFGESTGVLLGKKYVCGVINKDEFDKITCDLLPANEEEERAYVMEEFRRHKENLEGFKKACSHDEGVCHKCHRDKPMFSSLIKIDHMKLCKVCFKVYEDAKFFEGYHGRYIHVAPTEIEPNVQPQIEVLK